MKKKLFSCGALVLMMIVSAFSAAAQNPVKWTASVKMTSKTNGVITLTAKIEKGWHIYGLESTDDGPVATALEFKGSNGVVFTSPLKASVAPVTVTDDMFGCEVKYWEDTVTFTRKFKVPKKAKDPKATITVTYMSCNDSSCRPPQTEEITVKLK